MKSKVIMLQIGIVYKEYINKRHNPNFHEDVTKSYQGLDFNNPNLMWEVVL